MLVGVPYLAIANVCTILIDRGAPEWLHLVVLWGIWNAFRFVLNAPISLFRLMRAVMREQMMAQAVRPTDRSRAPSTHAAELHFVSRRRGRPPGRLGTP